MSTQEDFVPIYFKHVRGLSALTNEQLGHVCRAVIQYAESGVLPELDQSCAVAVGFILGDMEDQRKAVDPEYEARRARNRENGRKGGRPRKDCGSETQNRENPENPVGYFENRKKPVGFSENPENPVGYKEEESGPLLPPEKEKKSSPPHPPVKENKEIPPIIPQKEGEGTAESADADSVSTPQATVDPEAENGDAKRTPIKQIVDLYHRLCPSFGKLKLVEGKRKEAIVARWKVTPDLAVFEELFRLAEASDFLKGQNDRNWRANFDWLMCATNFQKVLEHRYDNKIGSGAPPGAEDRDPFIAFMDAAARGEEWTG